MSRTINNESQFLEAVRDYLAGDDDLRVAVHRQAWLIDDGDLEKFINAYNRYSPLVVLSWKGEEIKDEIANYPLAYSVEVSFTVTVVVHTLGNIDRNRADVYDLKEKIIARLLGRSFEDYGIKIVKYTRGDAVAVPIEPYGVGVELTFVGEGIRQY